MGACAGVCMDGWMFGRKHTDNGLVVSKGGGVKSLITLAANLRDSAVHIYHSHCWVQC